MHIFLEIIYFQFFFESLHFFCWTSTHTTRNVIFITREPHIKTKTKRPPPLPLARCCCCCCCWQHHIVRMVSGSRALSLSHCQALSTHSWPRALSWICTVVRTLCCCCHCGGGCAESARACNFCLCLRRMRSLCRSIVYFEPLSHCALR